MVMIALFQLAAVRLWATKKAKMRFLSRRLILAPTLSYLFILVIGVMGAELTNAQDMPASDFVEPPYTSDTSDLAGRARDAEARYTEIWATMKLALELADPKSALNLFMFKYKEVSVWRRQWQRPSCQIDPACIAKMEQSVTEMAAWGEAAIDDGRIRAAVKVKKEDERKQQLIREANARREAEAREAKRKVLVMAEADRVLTPGTMLWHIWHEEFAEADSVAAEIVRNEIAGPAARAAKFFSPSLDKTIEESIVANRRNLMVAAYGLTRYQILGKCNDEVARVHRYRMDDMVTRNGFGKEINRVRGNDVYTSVPRKFAPMVKSSHFESGGVYFVDVISSIGSCANPLLQELEDRIMAFAYRRRG